MLRCYLHDAEDVVELHLDGAVNREDYERVRAETEAFIEKRGRARLLEVIYDIGPVDPEVIWEDMAFAFRHWDDFSRIAVVAERRWLAVLLAGLQKLFSGEVRGFALDECAEAWKWLTEHALRHENTPACLKKADAEALQKSRGR
jgi:hypothetical protein